MDSTLAFANSLPARSASPSRRVAGASALLATACVLGLVEAALPGLPFAPWLRFGFANIAVVLALALYGSGTAAVVSLGRVGVIGLATGSLFAPASAMAAAGAVASLLIMSALSRYASATTPISWSAAGSAMHVLAQFGAAAAILGSGSLFVIAPPSVLVALVLGALVGYLAQVAVSRLRLG